MVEGHDLVEGDAARDYNEVMLFNRLTALGNRVGDALLAVERLPASEEKQEIIDALHNIAGSAGGVLGHLRMRARKGFLPVYRPTGRRRAEAS